MNLLIVDDEMWSRKLVRNLLPWNDYGIDEIYEAEGGDEAYDLISNHQIDLMITDMRMPGSDGAALLQLLYNNNIDIEVIVMSGYEDYKYLHSALKVKAIDYLIKPIVKEELHSAVMTGIDRLLKRDSYNHIEEILLRDDLRSELNRYYEIKNSLLKSISKSLNNDILTLIDEMYREYFTHKSNPNFINFIMMDLKRSIYDLEKENGTTMVVETVTTLDKLKDRMLHLSSVIQKNKNKGKVSILDVQKYISKHLEEALSLSDLAQHYFISKEHLSRQFKKEVGISVQNYINDKKMEYAKNLLRNHSMISISNIPSMCGYSDLHYFYRIFKKITGITPVQYREEYQNSPKDKSK